MRVPAYPPFIVFFDTIAIFLFVLILNQSSGFEFVLPKKSTHPYIFSGARIVYEKNGNLWFDDSGQRFVAEDIDVYSMVDCDHQPLCATARRNRGTSKVHVLIPESLHSEGGKISMVVSKLGCSSLKVHISPRGTVDREATFASNACMKKINGVENWVRGKPLDSPAQVSLR